MRGKGLRSAGIGTLLGSLLVPSMTNDMGRDR